LTADQLREMEKAGWETGGHGWKHDNLTAVPIDSVEKFVAADFQFLVDSGLSHESFAYAYGNYNDTVQSIVSRYFANIRTTHDYDYLSGINRKALGYYAVQSGSVADDLIGRVAQATAEGSPLVVFCFHVILSDTAAPPVQSYWCTEEAFSGFVRYLAAGEFSVLSVRDAMAFLQVN
jgi:peptidoglycan/xylan/chitin deacetylase (PgdA/CDA1 family)